eukprot:scaffold334_cov241-Pinguiococcus_pyrenoidosus.AAC.28
MRQLTRQVSRNAWKHRKGFRGFERSGAQLVSRQLTAIPERLCAPHEGCRRLIALCEEGHSCDNHTEDSEEEPRRSCPRGHSRPRGAHPPDPNAAIETTSRAGGAGEFQSYRRGNDKVSRRALVSRTCDLRSAMYRSGSIVPLPPRRCFPEFAELCATFEVLWSAATTWMTRLEGAKGKQRANYRLFAHGACSSIL